MKIAPSNLPPTAAQHSPLNNDAVLNSPVLNNTVANANGLVDGFGRAITYARLSVTDRCDLRCVYCMAEDMTFVPRSELLTLEEIARLGATLTELGVTKLRITGGEPLVRRGVISLFEQLGQLPKLHELCLTTNGTRLVEYAQSLHDAGVDRINISLDSLNAERFRQLTRFGDVHQVLAGIRAAQRAGFKRIKINCVPLKSINAHEVPDLVKFALNEGVDISFIEEMPLGRIDDHGRAAEFISSAELRELINASVAARMPLVASEESSGGPARYWTVPGFVSKIGFISPHSQNFCGSCNRIRVTATGRLLLCLGQENSVDLRAPLRGFYDDVLLRQTISGALRHKPLQHNFNHTEEPQILRFMNTTGG
jgi:cyclic pyranopterin phosphate synthase